MWEIKKLELIILFIGVIMGNLLLLMGVIFKDKLLASIGLIEIISVVLVFLFRDIIYH